MIKLFAGPLSIGKNADLLADLIGLDVISLEITQESIQLNDQIPVWIEGELMDGIVDFPLNQRIEVAGQGFIFSDIDDVIPPQNLPERKTVQRIKTNKEGRRLTLQMMLLCAVGCLVCIIIFWPESKETSNTTTLINSKQWVIAQIKKTHESAIIPKWDNDRLILTGYCKNHLRKNHLIGLINAHNIIFTDQVTCEDSLITDVKTILKNQGYASVSVTAGKTLGTVNIQNNMPDNDKWVHIIDILGSIAGLKGWNISHTSGNEIRALIQALREKNVLAGLRISQLGNKLLVIGESEHSDTVRSVIDTIEKTSKIPINYKDIPVIVNSELSAEVTTYISHTGKHFVVLANGKTLSKGSITASGYRVNFIDKQGMDLSKQSDRVHIPFLF